MAGRKAVVEAVDGVDGDAGNAKPAMSRKAKATSTAAKQKGAGKDGGKGGSTGPVSAAGKSKSSLNALRHGLTSTRVLPDEIEMVEEFARELAEHYKPQSPLEMLQIQRIAFCRAKLAKLIDIEVAGRELARFDIDHRPEQTMDRLAQYPAHLRHWALEILEGRNPLDEIKIDEAELSAIHEEILQSERPTLDPQARVIDGERKFECLFPKLSEYLRRVYGAALESQRQNSADRAPSLFAALSHLSKQINFLRSTRKHKGSQETGFEEMLRQVHLNEEITKIAEQSTDPSAQYTPVQYNLMAREALDIVSELAAIVAQLPRILQSFEQTKQWMLRAADLTADNADRMMKYQTMLERRLSTAIGELIELQKLRH